MDHKYKNDYPDASFFDLNIIKFITDFPYENNCRLHLKGIRDQQGIKCKRFEFCN